MRPNTNVTITQRLIIRSPMHSRCKAPTTMHNESPPLPQKGTIVEQTIGEEQRKGLLKRGLMAPLWAFSALLKTGTSSCGTNPVQVQTPSLRVLKYVCRYHKTEPQSPEVVRESTITVKSLGRDGIHDTYLEESKILHENLVVNATTIGTRRRYWKGATEEADCKLHHYI